MKSAYLVLTFILLLVGCQTNTITVPADPTLIADPTSEVSPSNSESNESVSPTQPSSTPSSLPDAAYSDLVIPDGLLTELRIMEDVKTNPEAMYRLHEYIVTDSISAVEKCLRDETARLGGKVTERFGYNTMQRLDLNLKLPSKEGMRVISTYIPKYGNEQHLVVLESMFDSGRNRS